VQIELSAGEHVTAVAGTVGRFGSVPDAVVTSLAFRTSTGRTYGPYGSRTAAAAAATFSVPARRLLGALRLACRRHWGPHQAIMNHF
jgi:hypothetical protein